MRDGTIDVTAHDSARVDSGGQVADVMREFVRWLSPNSVKQYSLICVKIARDEWNARIQHCYTLSTDVLAR